VLREEPLEGGQATGPNALENLLFAGPDFAT